MWSESFVMPSPAVKVADVSHVRYLQKIFRHLRLVRFGRVALP